MRFSAFQPSDTLLYCSVLTKLGRSLINPNQLRMSGTIVHDDPTTDGDKEFGLITDNLFIPFHTAGVTVYFESMAPTHDEVEQLMHQVIGPTEWDPSTVRLQDKSQPTERAVS